MTDKLLEKRKIDPAENKQSFTEINIRLHCCRYWILEEWECNNMAFPFWRLYFNTKGNAKVLFNHTQYTLSYEKFILIPPNTSFATSLKGNFQIPRKESIVGEKIKDMSELKYIEKFHRADHLFIHFNLGFIADTIKPGIYMIENSPVLDKLALKIKKNSIQNSMSADVVSSMAIHNLILSLVSSLDPDLWSYKSIDHRVLMAMNYIEKNLGQKLTNADIASKANMAKNAFARLFHQNTQISLQEHIRKQRVVRACNLMHHSTDSIESIALNCGFVDRQHFSRVFKKAMNITPAHYKKFHTIDVNE